MNAKKLQLEFFGKRVTRYALRIAHNEHAFSLTEVLIAVGILAVAMVFIAGLFPTAIYFSTVSTERTIAAAAADEAFAKINLYGSLADFNALTVDCTDFRVLSQNVSVPDSEFSYPSNPDTPAEDVKYFWSALCRRLSQESVNPPKDRRVQVTVFVTRKTGFSTKYQKWDSINRQFFDNGLWPTPVPVDVTFVAVPERNQLRINDPAKLSFINAGSTIVDGFTGAIYRVLRRNGGTLDPDIVVLDKPWLGGNGTVVIWAVPPPVGGGRYPCIAVYQKVLRF